jgi:hypothetical protein
LDKLLVVVAGATVAVLLALHTWRAGPRRVLSALLMGLAWDEPAQSPALTATGSLLVWLAHAGGLAYLWRLAGQRYLLAVPLGLATAALLLLPQWPTLVRRHKVDVTVFSALAVPYAAGLVYGLGLVPAAEGLALLRAAQMAAVGYVLLVQVQRRWGARAAPAALLLLACTGLWAAGEYLGGRTQGVTGSDPYCYAQMAVDLARVGDVRHTFDLVPLVRDLGITWWPLVHVGYHVPDGANGLAATVWPVGWPVLLAGGYVLLGESGLYLWAPLAGLASLAATAALAWELWPNGRPRERWLGLALALLILATSREQVLQLLVPMADVPAQLFTVLALWLALRAGRRGCGWLAGLAGVALGVAYDIRHTQVVLAPVVALALWPHSVLDQDAPIAGGIWRWARLAAAAAVGACLAAAPDLWYHHVAFGSAWRPESPELNLIGLEHWWANALRMVAAMASRAEFGLLLPLLLYGIWRLWRDNRRAALLLAGWLLLNGGSQCLYGPLRWRDLLAIVPALALLSAYGATGLLRWLGELRRLGGWAPGWAALTMALLLAWRTGPVLSWPGLKVEMTFGYMLLEQRRAFDLLSRLVEPEAVVGSSLNSGPIELYTGRSTFRPGDWAPNELDLFLTAMAAASRPVYLLDDGNEHAAVVERLRGEGRLVALQALDVPLYGDRARLSGMLYRVR